MAEGKRREERRRNMQRGQRYGMNSIFHRISVRKYQNRDVEQEKIELMLKAAMAAPSACNQQPWEFYVVKDKAVIGRLSEASPYAKCAKDAPVVFVPCFRSKGIAPEYFNIDMSAAVENLLLEADELGLGAVWMGISPDEGRMKAVREVLDIPEDLHAFALIPCGYPAEERAQEDRYEESRVHYIIKTGRQGKVSLPPRFRIFMKNKRENKPPAWRHISGAAPDSVSGTRTV